MDKTPDDVNRPGTGRTCRDRPASPLRKPAP